MELVQKEATNQVGRGAEPRRFLFLNSSGRAEGNTAQLAKIAARVLPAEVVQDWQSLELAQLAPFYDLRHQGDGAYPVPEARQAELLSATLAASDIVLVTPLYWYNMSSAAKLYFEHWSAWMRVPEVEFLARMQAKRFWLISTAADDDKAIFNALVEACRRTADYAGMEWAGSLLGYANRPGDILHDQATLKQAQQFFNINQALAA